jgi:hypothetical protein
MDVGRWMRRRVLKNDSFYRTILTHFTEPFDMPCRRGGAEEKL